MAVIVMLILDVDRVESVNNGNNSVIVIVLASDGKYVEMLVRVETCGDEYVVVLVDCDTKRSVVIVVEVLDNVKTSVVTEAEIEAMEELLVSVVAFTGCREDSDTPKGSEVVVKLDFSGVPSGLTPFCLASC